MILASYNLSDLPHRWVPLWYHKQNRMQTASGYGRRLATEWMVKLPGGKRWQRVYCCIYSNSGTCYVLKGTDWVVIYGGVPADDGSGTKQNVTRKEQ